MKISLIVPTYNMSAHLVELCTSLETSNAFSFLSEIIFVNDGSTDDTLAKIEAVKKNSPNLASLIRVVSFAKNHGRFLARLEGARVASNEWILFLDSRITLTSEFSLALEHAIERKRTTIGTVRIDIHRNLFCLYWDRSHRFIFRNHFKYENQLIELTKENYSEFLKGTTILLSTKVLFLECAEPFKDNPPLNDDTFLLERMVEKDSLLIDPKLVIDWVPRESFIEFLSRLWERGPSFVEYHFLHARGLFFYVVCAGLLLTSAEFLLLFVRTPLALKVLAVALLLIAASTLPLSKTVIEFFILIPLHTAVVLTFGISILKSVIFRK